jgi:hypothetical protein
MTLSPSTAALQILFKASLAELIETDDGAVLHLPLPHLAGPDRETLGSPGSTLHWDDGFLIATDTTALVGAAIIDVTDHLDQAIERAYRSLLRFTQGWHLYRVWNYIPGINEVLGGLERYQQFNVGRWAAFESVYGRDLRSYMPAASAVGLDGNHAVLIFQAGKTSAEYLENPSQIPAYHYPTDYGPRPPSFARGVVTHGPAHRLALLSGTASIEGHRSIGIGDVTDQLRITQHNIEIMLRRMQATAAWQPHRWLDGGIEQAHFKCYLRHPEQLTMVREWIRESCGQDDHFTYVQANICRSVLDVEIEGQALLSTPKADNDD